MKPNDIKDFEEAKAAFTARIDLALEDYLSARSPACLYDTVTRRVEAGGTRVRPLLLLLVGGAVGSDEPDFGSIMPAAIAVELVHALTVVHENLIDGQALRQGGSTIHSQGDVSIELLAGDVLFPTAFEALLETSTSSKRLADSLDILSRACRRACEGQALSRALESRDSVTETEYLEMARLQTGELFAASARLGAVLVGDDGTTPDRAAAFGRNLGIGYHLSDEMVDITGEPETSEKEQDRPVEPGNRMLLPVYAHQHGVDVSDLGRASGWSDGRLVSSLEVAENIEYTQKRATEYAQTARQFLTAFPETTATEHLRRLADSIGDYPA